VVIQQRVDRGIVVRLRGMLDRERLRPVDPPLRG
jgi:hypothetical protein